MGPWRSRRPAPPTATPPPADTRQPVDDLVSRLHNTSLHTPPRQLAQFPNFIPFDNSQLNADSSSSESELHPSRPRRPKHSRSMSHPFPSLFSSKKKRQGPAEDSDSSSNDVHPTRGQGQAGRYHRRGDMNGGSRDFMTGNCMTCNSLVRWPRDLRVFKCTVCVTVNDLPHDDTSEPRTDSGRRWAHNIRHNRSPSQSKPNTALDEQGAVRSVSVEHTRKIIRQCIRTYLISVFRKVHGSQEGDPSLGLYPTPDIRDGTPGVLRAIMNPGIASSTWETTGDNPSSFIFRERPTLHPNTTGPRAVNNRSYSSSYPGRPPIQDLLPQGACERPPDPMVRAEQDGRQAFKVLEDYIISSFRSFRCINSSFHVSRAADVNPTTTEVSRHPSAPRARQKSKSVESQICDLDPKLLLLGDFAENGMWWIGDQTEARSATKPDLSRPPAETNPLVTTRSPQVDWEQLSTWYATIINAAETWTAVYEELRAEEQFDHLPPAALQDIEFSLLTAQDHVQRILLKATEMLLKRPGRPMTGPEDARFLLIITENPLLHAGTQLFRGTHSGDTGMSGHHTTVLGSKSERTRRGPVAGHHSGIIKRVVGLVSNASGPCQTHLTAWFARYPEPRFLQLKELVSGFLTYRLIRQNDKKHEAKIDVTDGLIPNMGNGRSAASLHAALGTPSSSKKSKEPPRKVANHDDWQIRAAARFLALLFAANNTLNVRRADTNTLSNSSAILRPGVQVYGQLLPTSDFYNSIIDYADLVADFEAWEAKRGKFTFCQYPFLLSIWAKSQILEHDAHRQMMTRARDAFFDSIMTRKNITQYLTLDVRRDCLVEDSLTTVSEVIGSGSEDIKKRLRIVFKGEEGYDAGGLRKEWFLLLVREVFNPDHGMFIYDEDSQLCYFNPNSFETSDQFFLVGVVIGLAIYNSTILDIALPPFSYRKLLSAAPMSSPSSAAHPRPNMTYSLEDLAEYRPRLAAGLKQLLDYDGDVEETFGLDFVVPMEKYGVVNQVPLCSEGERKPVTAANRKEFVDLYVRYLLDTAVARQFEPFKRGFYTVCGGNALSLFRPEEIELLVRGSDASLDIDSLRAVAEYDNWGTKTPDGRVPVIQWFWEAFRNAIPSEQRKLLLFITGSDRIPAMGASLLPIKITCLGDDEDRFPIARTCFNMLSLRRYKSRERLEHMLWRAVHESEGFGLK